MAAQKIKHLADAGDVRDLQVGGELDVAGGVGEDAERRGDHHRRHDGETVEAVGEIHGVAGADDDEVGDRRRIRRWTSAPPRS